MNLKLMRQKLNRHKTEYEYQSKRLREELLLLSQSEDSLAVIIESQQLIQSLAATAQHQAHQRIAGIVTQCLAAVFDNPYTFIIHFEEKRSKTEARFMFERNGKQYSPKAVGGGVIDVASFALRIARLTFSVPQCRLLLILDEAFKMVSRNYAPKVRAMMEALVEDLKFQIVQVTHNPELACGHIIEIGGG